DGVGVKKALRALVLPVGEVAEAIEQQDLKALSGLPRVDTATAERIVAKLPRKIHKFALMGARAEPQETAADRDALPETFEALRALGHSESDARRLVESALDGKTKFKTVEDMLQAIYLHSHKK